MCAGGVIKATCGSTVGWTGQAERCPGPSSTRDKKIRAASLVREAPSAYLDLAVLSVREGERHNRYRGQRSKDPEHSGITT